MVSNSQSYEYRITLNHFLRSNALTDGPFPPLEKANKSHIFKFHWGCYRKNDGVRKANIL